MTQNPLHDHPEDDLLFTASIPQITPSSGRVDWSQLENTARAVMTRAYVPYSHFPVGAAAVVEDGRVVAGCNIENASYGVTLCAECSLVSELNRTGGGRITAFICVNGQGEVIMPCGRCRQLLHEFRAPGMVLMTPLGVRTMEEVLPQAFGPDDVAGTAVGP